MTSRLSCRIAKVSCGSIGSSRSWTPIQHHLSTAPTLHPQASLVNRFIRNFSIKSGIGHAQHFLLTSRKTEIVKSARGPKLQGLLAENAQVIKYLEHKILTRTSAPRKPVARSKKGTIGPRLFLPQFRFFTRQFRDFGESLIVCTTETWSPRGRRNGADQHQRNDLGLFMSASMKAAVHLGKDYERKSACHEEHGILRDRASVLHHAEINP